MCGIAGFINGFSGPGQSMVYLNSMLESLQHRGPDGLGTYQDKQISFGMRRLSIIGGDQGKQPKSFAEGTSHLVFNGEIYNYLEILTGRNNSAHQTKLSDTDALVSVLKKHGKSGLPVLNGMFAAALWSSSTKKLLLFRDRLGKKPLYYYWDKKNFAFASEIKALKQLPFFQSDINQEGLSHYLTFRYIPNQSSIYKNIHKVKPGHWLEFDTTKRTLREERWWNIPKPTTFSQATSKIIPQGKKFERIFESSVELRLRADVNVGIFLSGGLDSSCVAAAAQKIRGDKSILTFSVGFAEEEEVDERMYGQKVAKYIGCEHQEVTLRQKQFMDFLPHFVQLTDEPQADLSSIPLYYLCKEAKKSVTVALGGEGADEILAGYNFHEWYPSRRPIEARESLINFLQKVGILQNIQEARLTDLRDEVIPSHITNYLTSKEKAQLLKPEFGAGSESLDIVRGLYQSRGATNTLDQILFAYCHDWLTEDLLMKADKMSMANSLEVRAPFLDHRLVKWAFKAANHLKVEKDRNQNWTSKSILKKYAMKRLPPEIVNRKKMGFPTPAYAWSKQTQVREFLFELVASENSILKSYFEISSLRKFFNGTFESFDQRKIQTTWNLAILSLWLDSNR